ncbi:hypothetical protein [Amycolatopsis sp. NPDC001319]|uniref:hypothetical protein n=1 Tax=unclassified Amycolatopsis TaxID=2618356 RepID=UPI0036C109D4
MTHRIEHMVYVYLVWGEGGWEIDGTTMSGEPLDEMESGAYSQCECSDVEGCNAALAQARDAVAPTGRELFKAMADYIRKVEP